jgi:hypothetical protein
MCCNDSDVSSSLAEGGRERCAVRPAHTPSPGVRARRSSGNRSGRRGRRRRGSGDRSVRNRRMRSSSSASSRDSLPRRLRSTCRRTRKRRRKVTGGSPLRGGSLRPPRREPQRRRRNKFLGRARERSPPGDLCRRRRTPRRCQCVPRRRPEARRWRRRPWPQRPLSPRGRGSGASPP